MKQVEDIFKPATRDLLTLFSSNGVIFQIPSYQRNYAWTKTDVVRLVKDIEEGFLRLDNTSPLQSLCFLGSIITVNISDKLDQTNCPLNVVDGQQRLTTTMLFLLSINTFLYEAYSELKELSTYLRKWLKDEIDDVHEKTINCLFETKIRELEAWEYMPKIAREGLDTLSFRKDRYNYSSPVAKFLYQYVEYILSRNDGDAFSWKLNASEEEIGINNALSAINEELKSASYLKDTCASSLLGTLTNFYNLKDFDLETIKSDIKKVPESEFDKIEKLIKVISLSKYVFTNVVITEVRTYEKYQFDAFESLNTAGVPLTALDIFRAKALSNNDLLVSSDIEKLNSIDSYTLSIPHKSRSKVSREIVTSFISYISGIKTEDHLSWQRNKLIDLYDNARYKKYTSSLIDSLKEVVDFRKNFWDKKELTNQLDDYTDRDEVLVYFDYFRELDSTRTIPILTRMVNVFTGESLVRCIRALASFTLLWRLAHPNTSGIDSVYRKLMLGSSSFKPFCVGAESKNDLLSETEFLNFLESELRRKKIETYSAWANKSKGIRIYDVSKPSVKLALLSSYHRSKLVDKNDFIITQRGVKTSTSNNLLNLSAWRSERYATIEHIAPQNIKNAKDWDARIYQDGEVLPNCLGNLTLLPEAENTAIGNNNWRVKKQYFKCFVAEDVTEVDLMLDELHKSGLTVKNAIKSLMRENHALGLIVQSLLNVEEWNRSSIEKRQQNLSELIWDSSAEALNLEPRNY